MVIPYRQDVPPPGGFPSIDDRLLKRGLPQRGPSSLVTLGFVGITVAVGFFFTIRANHKNRELKLEQKAMRANIVPFLVAEEDIRWVKAQALLVAVQETLATPTDSFSRRPFPAYRTEWKPPSPAFKSEI